ncbi:hypothetical protein HaLaN_17030, partial [Haematococcus lacustris]
MLCSVQHNKSWLRLYGTQDRALEQFFNKLEEDMAEVSMKRHGHAKQLVVFFGAASIGTRGGWGADEVMRACCKVFINTHFSRATIGPYGHYWSGSNGGPSEGQGGC